MAVATAFADVVRHNPHINNLVLIDKAKSALAVHVPGSLPAAAASYDLVVDLQRNLRSFALRCRFRARTLLVDKFRQEKLDMVKRKVFPQRVQHVVDRYFEAVSSLDCLNDGEGLEFWLPSDSSAKPYAQARSEQRAIVAKSADRLIVLAPGAQHYTKRWPAEKFAALARRLKQEYAARIVLIGSAADVELCAQIHKMVASDVEDYSGRSLYESAEMVDKALLVVSNDSGAMHIAAARRVPVVAIYGSTVAQLGFTPYAVRSTIVEVPLDCRPCSHVGRSSCPLGHLHCLQLITVDQLMAGVETLVAEG